MRNLGTLAYPTTLMLMQNLLTGIALLLTLSGIVPAEAQTDTAPPAPVVVAKAERKMLAPVIWFPASVISRNDARLAAAEEGRLLAVVDVGTRVTKGDVIAEIDDKLMREQMSEGKAAINKERARLEFYQREVARLEKLTSGNNVAQNRLDEAIVNRSVTRSELSAAQARVAQTAERLRRSVVTAPFSGVITQRLKQAGEWASSGDVVVRLVNFTALEVQGWIPVNALAFIADGTHLDLMTDTRVSEGVVRTIVPIGEDRSKLYEVRLSVAAQDWTVGQTLRIAVPSEQPRNVVAVPRDALVLRRDSTTVYRITEDNIAEAVSVVLGIAAGDLIEVSGIESGDRVVTRGGERLRPGQTVSATMSGEQE